MNKNDKRGFAPIAVLAIIVALSLVGGGYYIAKTNVFKKLIPSALKDFASQSPELSGGVSQKNNKNTIQNIPNGFSSEDKNKFDKNLNRATFLTRNLYPALISYYEAHGSYPTSLNSIALPSGFRVEDFLYAYYPSTNPQNYHVGIRVEPITYFVDGKKFDYVFGLGEDADFDSSSAGYVNGFSGKDPVLDMKAEKGKNDPEQMRTRNAYRISQVHAIGLGLGIYFQEHKKYPPQLADLIPKYIKQIGSPTSQEHYLFSLSSDGLHYHIGVFLEQPNSSYVAKDADFNSVNAGWTNGFDGSDPVYDLTNK